MSNVQFKSNQKSSLILQTWDIFATNQSFQMSAERPHMLRNHKQKEGSGRGLPGFAANSLCVW